MSSPLCTRLTTRVVALIQLQEDASIILAAPTLDSRYRALFAQRLHDDLAETVRLLRDCSLALDADLGDHLAAGVEKLKTRGAEIIRALTDEGAALYEDVKHLTPPQTRPGRVAAAKRLLRRKWIDPDVLRAIYRDREVDDALAELQAEESPSPGGTD